MKEILSLANIRRVFLPALLLAAFRPSTHAADRTWVGTTGNWVSSAYWSQNAPPTINDNASINSGTATLPDTYTGAYKVLNLGETVGSSGHVVITGGSLSGTTTNLGVAAGSLGTLTVTSGSFTSAGGSTYVGLSGTGRLNVNGGSVFTRPLFIGNSPSGHGSVTVSSGTMSVLGFLHVGYGGTGELHIDGGYTQTLLSSVTHIGGAGAGTATITGGAFSTLGINVGNAGGGTLNINGGSVSTTNSFIGMNGRGTVTFTSGTWTNTAGLAIGQTGTATGHGNLQISGGYLANGGEAFLGTAASTSGTATITSGTWLNTNALYVGHSGTGTLTISGGLVTSGSTSAIGVTTTGVGTVLITGQGSTWVNSGSLTIGQAASNNTVTVRDHALLKIGDAVGETIALSTSGGTDNFLRLDSGYLALYGDQTAYINSLIASGKFQLWDGSAWITADSDDISIIFYTADALGEAAALAATGYSGLAGYSVAVPEPSAYALLAFGLGAIVCRYIRRRRAA